MEEAFRALLLASSGVTALVSGRVNWGTHPQGQPLPGVVLNVISDTNGHLINAPETLTLARVQVDCWAPTYASAKALGRAARAALDGHRGGKFLGVFLAGARDGREGGTNEADRPFRVSLDFLVHFNPTN